MWVGLSVKGPTRPPHPLRTRNAFVLGRGDETGDGTNPQTVAPCFGYLFSTSVEAAWFVAGPPPGSSGMGAPLARRATMPGCFDP